MLQRLNGMFVGLSMLCVLTLVYVFKQCILCAICSFAGRSDQKCHYQPAHHDGKAMSRGIHPRIVRLVSTVVFCVVLRSTAPMKH